MMRRDRKLTPSIRERIATVLQLMSIGTTQNAHARTHTHTYIHTYIHTCIQAYRSN